MLNPMLYAILELILWHKYENKREKKNGNIPPLTKPLKKNLQKINNQWRDNKTYDFIKEYKKLKKLH